MQSNGLLLILFAFLAWWFHHASTKGKSFGWTRLEGCKILFAIVAFAMALLIVMTPEFLALGLMGDTAFFDMLVLALSLQLH